VWAVSTLFYIGVKYASNVDKRMLAPIASVKVQDDGYRTHTKSAHHNWRFIFRQFCDDLLCDVVFLPEAIVLGRYYALIEVDGQYLQVFGRNEDAMLRIQKVYEILQASIHTCVNENEGIFKLDRCIPNPVAVQVAHQSYLMAMFSEAVVEVVPDCRIHDGILNHVAQDRRVQVAIVVDASTALLACIIHVNSPSP